jgi:hypothetical protein
MALDLKGNINLTLTWATLAGLVGAMWWVFGFTAQVEDNTQGLRVATIRNISQELRYLETEKQKMILYEQEKGKSPLSTQILTGFNTDIKKLERERDCLKDGKDAKICGED